ncbi:35411_t:CDS:1, partial [Gigaspora margarita]
ESRLFVYSNSPAIAGNQIVVTNRTEVLFFAKFLTKDTNWTQNNFANNYLFESNINNSTSTNKISLTNLELNENNRKPEMALLLDLIKSRNISY